MEKRGREEVTTEGEKLVERGDDEEEEEED